MLECLIHTTDTFYRDPAMKDYNSDLDRVSNMKQGYLQAVRPGGFKWGKLELDPKRFLIVQIENNWFNPAWLELEYDKDGNEICDRRMRFPLAKILSLGEFEALKSITYNSTEKLTPIVKSVDLKTIAEVNDWDTQPDIIKLHGSAGDFSIQEDGGGDYTSLKTAVETEASDISGGSTDANFYISETWTSADTPAWDIDGWTMGSNNMLIQTQGDSRSADGKWRSDSYRITGTTLDCLDIETSNVTLDGLQCNITSTGRAINVSNEGITNSTIKNCIVDCGSSAQYGVAYNMVFATPATSHKLENCVIFRNKSVETTSRGIITYNSTGCTLDMVNCTVSGFNRGVDKSAGIINAKNCAVFNNDDDFRSMTSVDYCASDDGDGTNAQALGAWADEFTDYANGDFSIKSATSTLYDNGTATGRPSTDITGYNWITNDIGAFAWQIGGLTIPTNLNDGVKLSDIATRSLIARKLLTDGLSLSDLALADLLIGSIVWGHDTGITEDYSKNLSLWNGTGTITGTGDAEAIELNSDEYMESPIWHIGAGNVRLRKDVYETGIGTPTMYYKQGTTAVNCESDTWHEYSSTFVCNGWIKIRLENNGN